MRELRVRDYCSDRRKEELVTNLNKLMRDCFNCHACTAPTCEQYIEEIQAKLAEIREILSVTDTPPREDLADWLRQVIQVAVLDHSAVSTLEAKLADHPDTKRLDWLEAEKGNAIYGTTSYTYKVSFRVGQGEYISDCGSLRGAIDAAMSQTAKEADRG